MRTLLMAFGEKLGDFAPWVLLVFLSLRLAKLIWDMRPLFPSKIAKLTDALQHEGFEEAEKQVLSDALSTVYFRRATGIGQSKERRKGIIRALEDSRERLSLSDFSEARSYLYFEGSEPRINITCGHQFSHLLTLVFFWAAVIIGIYLMFLFPMLLGSLSHKMVALGVGYSCVLLGVFIGFTTIPYYSARRVKKELDAAQSSSCAHEDHSSNID